MKPILAVPGTLFLVFTAWRKNSLTPVGLVIATLTAVAHAYHPWNLPFVLLCVFFLAGTKVTHVKENIKATLTMHSKGTPGGEGPRTCVQVLANSLMASVLSLLHAHQLRKRSEAFAILGRSSPDSANCFAWGGDLLVVGIIANYAAVAADTFSSELGILAKGEPRLITSLSLRKVPRGTSGGVTWLGLAAGLLGSAIIAMSAVLSLPLCRSGSTASMGGGQQWTWAQLSTFTGFLALWGALGSVLDSFLGGLFQQSVKDVRTGRIIEGEGGARVLLAASPAPQRREGTASRESGVKGAGSRHDRPSRVLENGWNVLDNNDVNFLMASVMSVGGMAAVGWYWGVPIASILQL